MQVSEAHRIAKVATRFRSAHPNSAALEVLDLTFGKHKGVAGSFPADLVAPQSRFGQLIAEAFDPAMTPDEWSAWAGDEADCVLRDALLRDWSREVLPAFAARYGLSP
jgi:hypothetical protein